MGVKDRGCGPRLRAPKGRSEGASEAGGYIPLGRIHPERPPSGVPLAGSSHGIFRSSLTVAITWGAWMGLVM